MRKLCSKMGKYKVIGTLKNLNKTVRNDYLMKSKAGLVGIIITLVVLIAVVIASNVSTGNLSFIESVAGTIFVPIQNGIVFLKNKITGNEQENSDIASLRQENQSLKDENSKLQEQVRELEILKSENNTLKEYVNLKDQYSEYTTVPAYVIERSISNYEKIVVINAGTDDGVQANMPVISESGLVGYVISATNSTAKVQTIIDTASNVSANISNVQDSVILKGTLNNTETVRATYIPADSTILQGDQVVTSGLGGIYPKGILIGTVKSVVNTKNEADRYAEIEVATDFSRLETVLVITQN